MYITTHPEQQLVLHAALPGLGQHRGDVLPLAALVRLRRLLRRLSKNRVSYPRAAQGRVNAGFGQHPRDALPLAALVRRLSRMTTDETKAMRSKPKPKQRAGNHCSCETSTPNLGGWAPGCPTSPAQQSTAIRQAGSACRWAPAAPIANWPIAAQAAPHGGPAGPSGRRVQVQPAKPKRRSLPPTRLGGWRSA